MFELGGQLVTLRLDRYRLDPRSCGCLGSGWSVIFCCQVSWGHGRGCWPGPAVKVTFAFAAIPHPLRHVRVAAGVLRLLCGRREEVVTRRVSRRLVLLRRGPEIGQIEEQGIEKGTDAYADPQPDIIAASCTRALRPPVTAVLSRGCDLFSPPFAAALWHCRLISCAAESSEQIFAGAIGVFKELSIVEPGFLTGGNVSPDRGLMVEKLMVASVARFP